MAQYIPKSALVAEINKRIIDAPINNIGHQRVWAYNDVKDIINSLEVKEVDLEKEVEDYWHNSDLSWCRDAYSMTHIRTMLSSIAKHFFELGLCSTITEEDCKLIWNIGDEIPNMPEEEFFKELLKRYKAKKGEEV